MKSTTYAAKKVLEEHCGNQRTINGLGVRENGGQRANAS